MAVRTLVAWGSKQWVGPLWPSLLTPEWAETAAKRMLNMGVTKERINEILQEMRNARVVRTIFIDGVEYGIALE